DGSEIVDLDASRANTTRLCGMSSSDDRGIADHGIRHAGQSPTPVSSSLVGSTVFNRQLAQYRIPVLRGSACKGRRAPQEMQLGAAVSVAGEWQRSLRVRIPTTRPRETTGRQPTPASAISAAAIPAGVLGRTVSAGLAITRSTETSSGASSRSHEQTT